MSLHAGTKTTVDASAVCVCVHLNAAEPVVLWQRTGCAVSVWEVNYVGA